MSEEEETSGRILYGDSGRKISRLDFFDLFTDAELESIFLGKKTQIKLDVFLTKVTLAGEINLDDPRTVGGVNWLESAGVLAAGRAAEILQGGQ